MREIKAGTKWNSLTLISDILGGKSFRTTHKSIFMCDCGLNHFASINNVERGIVKHCQSCSSKKKSKEMITHGNSISFKDRDPLGYSAYTRWQAMKRRCYIKTSKRYDDYGGRGITICDRWLESYENFIEDMGLPADKSYQIDRTDNNGNYEPGNCQWVTRQENGRNKRNNHMLAAFGKNQTLVEWAKETGIKRETIAMRIRRGYSAEKALDAGSDRISSRTYVTPNGSFASLKAAAESHSISISGASGRFERESCEDWKII